MQYFGYLRRNPNEAPEPGLNYSGFDFWLGKLNQFSQPGEDVRNEEEARPRVQRAEMVKSFVVSGEYRDRFAQPRLSIFSNPGDALLLRAATRKGELVEYFGEKNVQGLATALRSVRVKNLDGKVTNILLDSQARPTQIQAFNGVSFKIAWLSNTNMVLTALSADGTIQINVPYDLAAQAPSQSASLCKSCGQQPSAESSSTARSPGINTAPRGSASVRLAVIPSDLTKNQSPVPGVSAAIGRVNVTRCGTPYNDASVGITVVPSSAPLNAYNAPGQLTGSGQYSVSIPTQPAPGQGAENLCIKAAEKLGLGCDGLSTIPTGSELGICALLAAGVAGLGAAPAAAAILAACPTIFVAARLYCATLGWSPVPGAPSLLELLCGNISEIVDRFAGGELQLIPIVFIPGEGVIDSGSGVTVPASGPIPTFNINAGGSVKILSFATTPPDPAPFQDYLAEALIQCAPPGTRVTLSITGTDGYSDSATATIQGDANVTLTVPGAEAGIVDTVTVAVSGGPTRTIVLVF